MKTPERSRSSRVSQIVQSFCPKVLFSLWIERHVNRFSRESTYRQTERQKHGSDSMILTADAEGKNLKFSNHVKVSS